MPPNQSNNKFLIVFRWLTSTWAAVISVILVVLGSVFGAGYWSGCYVTANQKNYEMMNIRLEHQKEISDLKDKARDEAINDLKQKNDQSEKIYTILKEGARK